MFEAHPARVVDHDEHAVAEQLRVLQNGVRRARVAVLRRAALRRVRVELQELEVADAVPLHLRAARDGAGLREPHHGNRVRTADSRERRDSPSPGAVGGVRGEGINGAAPARGV